MMFHPKHVSFFIKKIYILKKVIFKSIVWFIKAICISYDVTKVM